MTDLLTDAELDLAIDAAHRYAMTQSTAALRLATNCLRFVASGQTRCRCGIRSE